jgi:hypothetical protein
MKKYLISALLLLPFPLLAQLQPTIDHLDFPYNLNYNLHLKGNLVIYDKQTGKEESSKLSEVFYHINKQKTNKDENMANFHCNQVSFLDSTFYDSPLLINKKGMEYWLEDSAASKKAKHKTQAILLPLYQGKKWSTYADDLKEEATCFATSTPLKTPCGTFDAFGIETTIVVEKTSEYQVVLKIQDYYTQKVGKIGSVMDTYVQFNTGKKIPLRKEELYLVDYTGYSKPQ